MFVKQRCPKWQHSAYKAKFSIINVLHFAQPYGHVVRCNVTEVRETLRSTYTKSVSVKVHMRENLYVLHFNPVPPIGACDVSEV